VAQLIRQLTAQLPLAVLAVFLGIEDLGLADRSIDLLLQLLLRPENPLVAHGLVHGGIDLNLGAVQRLMAQAHHPRLLAQPQDLHEKTLEGIEVAEPELADPAVVRLQVAGQHPEGQVLVADPLDLAGREDVHAVDVEQQHRQPLRGMRLHPRVKCLLAAGNLGLSGDQDLRKIELNNQVQQEKHLMDF
jgi:hypothetical protein